jgi:hypothetical protein
MCVLASWRSASPSLLESELLEPESNVSWREHYLTRRGVCSTRLIALPRRTH